MSQFDDLAKVVRGIRPGQTSSAHINNPPEVRSPKTLALTKSPIDESALHMQALSEGQKNLLTRIYELEERLERLEKSNECFRGETESSVPEDGGSHSP